MPDRRKRPIERAEMDDEARLPPIQPRKAEALATEVKPEGTPQMGC
jgi:hypothetical protein